MKTTISFLPYLADAIRSGEKTQTRRLISPQPLAAADALPNLPCSINEMTAALKALEKKGLSRIYLGSGMIGPPCKYGDSPGVTLDVLERHVIKSFDPDSMTVTVGFSDGFTHTVNVSAETISSIRSRKTNGRWVLPRYMFKEFSRTQILTLNFRVERLLDISEHDAIAEGIERIGERFKDYDAKPGVFSFKDPRDSFWSLFTSIHGNHVLAINPFVWVVDFVLIENVDICSEQKD